MARFATAFMHFWAPKTADLLINDATISGFPPRRYSDAPGILPSYIMVRMYPFELTGSLLRRFGQLGSSVVTTACESPLSSCLFARAQSRGQARNASKTGLFDLRNANSSIGTWLSGRITFGGSPRSFLQYSDHHIEPRAWIASLPAVSFIGNVPSRCLDR